MPVNWSTSLFPRVTVPVPVYWPGVAATVRWFVAENRMFMGVPLVVAPALPAAATMQLVAGTKELATPAYVMVTLVIDMAAVPVFVSVRVLPAAVATLHVGATTAPAVKSAALIFTSCSRFLVRPLSYSRR